MNRILATLLAAALAAAAPITAHAATVRVFRYNGSVCQPATLADGDLIYGQFGVANHDTVARVVVCPLPTANAGAATETMTNMATVTIYNRSSTTSLGCTLEALDTAGNIQFAQTLSNNTPGAGIQQLLFNPSGRTIQDTWLLICTLPGVQNGSYSHVAAITLTSQF